MARSQFRSRTTVSGKKLVDFRKKRACDLAGLPALTHIGNTRVKVKRVMGANLKQSLLSKDEVIVNKDGKVTKLKIEGVHNNPANVNFTRRNIITKGAIVKTNKGDVRITSRPGQSGSLFGVLL